MVVAAVVLVGVGVAWWTAPERELVTEVLLDAPPARVWEVLTDGARYSAWNPFIRSMIGEMVVGGRLENTMTPGGGAPMTFRPTILACEPGRELRWLGTLGVRRIFDGEHRFELHDLGDGRTRLVHAERFRGVALWVMDVERFRADFEAMNRALAARVQAA
jgi:hypothetical protein